VSQTKRRPALVVVTPRGDDLILCQITSQASEDPYSVQLDDSDFTSGGLSRSSRIRPNRLFTADSGILVYRAGHVSAAKLDETRERLIQILSEN
jgi:mRNA interferase MazF